MTVRSRAFRGSGYVIGIALGSLVTTTRPAWAGPESGEGRSILRDADRVYTVVAGEGDGASTVTNPANLGFLRGVNGIVDFAWTALGARRRGSGVGAFVGLPLPLRLAALGFGYQFLYPVQPDGGGSATNEPQNPDAGYSKVSFSLSVPLGSWIRGKLRGPDEGGLWLGLSYSRLASHNNFHAQGVNQVDLALAYWPIRFVALGIVGRGLNTPTTGPRGEIRQPLTIDPEIAIRPLGTPALEIAAGARISPVVPGAMPRFREFQAQPRGRLLVSIGGVRFFAEAEGYRYFPARADGSVDLQQEVELNAARLTAGIELNFSHVGIAAGALLGAGATSAGVVAAQGGVSRLRLSAERYDALLVPARRVTELRLERYGGDRGMWSLLEELERVEKRAGVAVLYTRRLAFSWAQVEEIREAIDRVRQAGGQVIVYLEGGSLGHYFLAAAADRIVAHPTSSLQIVGMHDETLYFADLLAKLGAKAEFVRVAEYKSVPEIYERMTASGPAAEQRLVLLSDLWNHVLRLVARDRGHDVSVIKRWIDRAPMQPEQALARGVVDELAYEDELDERVERWLGRKVRIEPPSKQRLHEADFGPQPRIGVLLVEGELIDGESFTIPLLGRKLAGAKTLIDEIKRLREDKTVRAVVVRCNSPGGLVSASSAIARELELVRKEKPVVISMGGLCASGGYDVITAGQYIFADAMTITGSIGIFYPKMDLSGTRAMFGVGLDRLDFGKRAGMRSWWKPYSSDERQAILDDLTADYQRFLAKVGRARNMTIAQVDQVARGRVWSGVRAAEVGLVDRYGGLREAIVRARLMANLRHDEGSVALYPKPPGTLETIRRIFNVKIPWPLGHERHPMTQAIGRGGLGVPIPLLWVLRRLPVSLWLMDGPQPLALAEATIEIGD